MNRKINLTHLNFKKTHSKINQAMEEGFYLEAIMLQYAILDNRINRLINLLQIEVKSNRFSDRFKALKKTLKSQIPIIEISSEISNLVTNFVNDRNKLTHEYINLDFNDLFTEKVAIDGLKIINAFEKLSKQLKSKLY
jgi:hypothetical protein